MASNNSTRCGYPYPTGPGFQRFSKDGFCPNVPYKSFMDGLMSKFDEAIFFTNVIQFALVTLMYVNVGKGRYWRILFYAGIAGVLGTLCEKSSISYTCREADVNNQRPRIYGFMVAEIFWVVKEYSIPFLNLTKIKAFSDGKTYKILNIIIYTLFAFFLIARFLVGYYRCTTGLLTSTTIKLCHMLAFSIMAIADLICTVGILWFVNDHNKQEILKTNELDHYIKRSSYIILVCVDVVSVILTIFNGLSEYDKNNFPESYVKPFMSIKCAFILILACDALLFKYSVNTSSARGSSNYRYETNGNFNATRSNNNYNGSTNYAGVQFNNTSSTSKIQNNRMSNVSPYSNYVDFNGKMDSYNGYQTKSIVKNYTSNIKPSPTDTLYEPSLSTPKSDKTFNSQSFGFLYQQKDYQMNDKLK